MRNDTAAKLLDAAERLTQTRGFNGFSYRDLEKEIGIKTASIHYHFPSKNDLGFHMVDRYVTSFTDKLAVIDERQTSPVKRISELAEIFFSVLKQNKFCLCLMMTTDRAIIPEKTQERVADFFKLTEKWIERNIIKAQASGDIRNDLHPKQTALQFMALLEGAMLVAHAHTNPKHLRTLYSQTMATWKP